MFTLEDQFICHSESYLTQETFVRVCQEAVQMKLSVSSTRKANLPRSPLSLLPLFSRPWAFYVLLLILSNQTLPRTLPANHVSAVKLKTTLLPVVSCHFGHSCSSYPALLSRVISPVVRSPVSFYLHRHHRCPESIDGVPILRTASLPPRISLHLDGV